MADFTLPRRRQTAPAPTLPGLTLPGRGDQSQAGVQGFLTRLPSSLSGPSTYQAGIDQSQEGQTTQAVAGMADQMLQLRKEQEQSLAQHKAYREGLKVAQQQVDTRNNDLRLAQNLLIATDPSVDKAVRKFMLAGLSEASGVDPKGKYSQDLQKMVMGMSPDALEALRGTFGNDITNSPPGAIQKQLNSLFSGETPIENVIGQVKQHQNAKAAAAAAATSPGLPLTSGASASGAAPVPEGAVAEGASELAGGAASTPGAAAPSPQQRQAVIAAAANMPAAAAAGGDFDTSGNPPPAPPSPASTPPLEAPGSSISPDEPTPPPIGGDFDTSGAPPAPSAPAPTPTPTPAPAASPDPATAAAGEAAGSGTVQPQTTPPPEPTSRMVVPDSLRKAAEESGDKLLLDAIAKIDQRNAVLDSDASHRKSLTARVGNASPSAQTATPTATDAAPAATAGTSSTAAAAAAAGGETAPTAAKAAAAATKSWGQKALEALPPDPITGIKPSDVFKIDNDGTVVTTSGDAPPQQEKVAKALTNETAPQGPSPGDKTNQWITDVNEATRRNPLPVNPNLPALEKKDIPPHEQEMRQGLRGMLPGYDPDPSKRYNAADMARPFPKAENTEAFEKHLREVNEKRDRALTDLYTPGTRLIDVLSTKDGKELVGKGVFMTSGEAAQISERARRVMGWDDKEYGVATKLYGDKAEEYVRGIAGLSNSERAALSREIAANLLRLEAAVALAQSPRGDINLRERELAREQVGSIDLGYAEIRALLKNNLDLTTKAANAQFAATTGNGVIDWRGLPRDVRDKVVELNTREPGIFNPEYVAQIHATNMQEDRRKAGAPIGENEYLATTGGNRPEMHEAAFQKDKSEKQAEEAIARQRAAAKEGRDIETHAIQKRHAEIAEDVEKRNKEKWEEEKRRHAAQEERQAMLDARHAQEKMAAAFQHIGAMIAGSVKSAPAGGSGIQAGPEDSSAFRLTPMPQRQAPRVGGVTPPTRYGGPIKRQQ